MSTLSPAEQQIRDLCVAARQAAQTLATLPTTRLDDMLDEIATELEKDREAIFAANAGDIAAAEQAGLHASLVDRLRITEKTLASMVKGVRQVRALPQPLGQKMAEWTRPNGIAISKIRVPIGVIAIIYESRPNVTIDAAVLCLKTGNATVLRGGKEAIHSNRALIAALGNCKSLPKGAVQLVGDTDRALVPFLCRQKDFIDVIIPRGGHSRIDTVVREAQVPVIKHAHGVCSVFVHAAADPKMAEEIVIN
ncbi:MAG TPA: glutamate-5-semialdehyde dehydrogenase, partial [Candidatus Methylacidiphilales bacterium]|nr:glutamate-5-semialdehyde dehydrogenase [Candidatus Methylacidiphilales bacterium]